jgi:NADP-dependent 3-hydroxy acid dehydrogenase YdfG
MKEESVKKVVDEHIKKYAGLDILVNNASKQMMCDDIADINVSPDQLISLTVSLAMSNLPSAPTSSACSL